MGVMQEKPSTSTTYTTPSNPLSGARPNMPNTTTPPKPNATSEPSPAGSIDYVTIIATVTLGCVAIFDLIYGGGNVALAIGGAVGGYVTRLYK